MTRTALYLAHLNPLTIAHAQIIDELRSRSERVVVMPVVFRDRDGEVNSKSFPFTFEARSQMIKGVFGEKVEVSDAYEFRTPFTQYMPPLLSRASWRLRSHILEVVGNDYFTYTGDTAEWIMLKIYALRPSKGKRKQSSATGVRAAMYESTETRDSGWEKGVPQEVAQIIKSQKNWEVVERFAKSEDTTRRVLGMKFPR